MTSPWHQKQVWDFNGSGEILFVDKPLDWTSHDVVKKLRSLLHIRKAGHAGTLDPRATGLLIVATGSQTKNMETFTTLEKEYTGSMQLGIRTASFDTETEILERKDYSRVTPDLLKETLSGFHGKQLQAPPMYSASKFGGKPLYTYARKGRTIERLPKEIEVKEFSILKFDLPNVDFRVVSSRGTYVRSLVDDVGQRLGCGACLIALRRTRIGPHRVDDALSVIGFQELAAEYRAKQLSGHEARIPA